LFQFENFPKDKNLDSWFVQKKKSGTLRFFDFRTRGYLHNKIKEPHNTGQASHTGNLLCKGWILYVSR